MRRQPVARGGYTIELVASGAFALDGVTIHDGWVYVTDFSGGVLYRVPVGARDAAFEAVASGLGNITDVAITPDDRIFVTNSTWGQLIEIVGGVRDRPPDRIRHGDQHRVHRWGPVHHEQHPRNDHPHRSGDLRHDHRARDA